jgi:hypothetical protein
MAEHKRAIFSPEDPEASNDDLFLRWNKSLWRLALKKKR